MLYTKEILDIIFKKGDIIIGENPKLYRKDIFGSIICRIEYGELSIMGWEVDHIIPLSKGGTNDLDNLQPLYWKNNRKKSDDLHPKI